MKKSELRKIIKEEIQVEYDGEINRLIDLVTDDLAEASVNLGKLYDVAYKAKGRFNNGFLNALTKLGDIESDLEEGYEEYEGDE